MRPHSLSSQRPRVGATRLYGDEDPAIDILLETAMKNAMARRTKKMADGKG